MSAETQVYQRIPEPKLTPNQIEIFTPRDKKGERIGIGAILEKRNTQPGRENESILQIALRSLLRYGRTMQEPTHAKERQALRDVRSRLLVQLQNQHEERQVNQWAKNHEDGHRYTTDYERTAFLRQK